jgi:hemerythrin-like metal-binding protein
MNKRFVWTQQYSVNVEEIDDQHKEFINICNSLFDLAESDSFTDEEALTKVGQLGSYAIYHLSTEEDLFIKTNYPDAVKHKAFHDEFRQKSIEFEKRIRDRAEDKKKVTVEIAEFVGSWLLNHILVVDKQYSKYFNEHGVK